MRIHLVVGPTGIGKTSRSVELAARWGCPVLVLDRVQCCPQVAVGAGRPTPRETLRDGVETTRVYLDERDLAQGVVGADEAVARLEKLLTRQQESGTPVVVLEGGSLSILRSLAYEAGWTEGRSLSVDQLTMADPGRYEAAVTTRVTGMLGYGADRSALSMLDEVAALWPRSAARVHLADIHGYREVLALCEERGWDPGELRTPTDPVEEEARRRLFVAAVSASHVSYGHEQEEAMAELVTRFRALGHPVGVTRV